MDLRGDIADFPAYEVVQLIAMGRRTGRLNLDGEIEKLVIYFIDGEAVFARSKINKDELGRILLSKGIVSEENVRNALRQQSLYTERGTNKRLGTIFVELGVLSRSVLEELLKHRIEDAIYAILSEEKGTYSFDDELGLDEDDILVPMNIEKIIQDGIRMVEERKRFKSSVPSMSAIYERNQHLESDIDLDFADWKVLSLIDGERTIEDIITETGYSPITIFKTLTAFSEDNMIALRE